MTRFSTPSLVVIGLLVSACGAAQESLPVTEPTPESSTDTVPVASGRCSPASAALASQIEGGANRRAG